MAGANATRGHMKKTKKSKQKKKVKSISFLKRQLDGPNGIFSKYIRLRDSLLTTGGESYCVCISCGETVDNIQSGHFMSRKHNSTRYHEKNVNGQCPKCNCFDKNSLLKYRRAIIERYGEKYDEVLEHLASQPKSWMKWELEEKIQHYKRAYKTLEENTPEWGMG